MALPITVPYTFGTATTAIPLSNLDSDYATVYQAVNGIGNGSVALANVQVTGVGTTFPNNYLANSSVTIGNTAVALGSTVTSFGNVTLTNATISSVSAVLTPAQGGTGVNNGSNTITIAGNLTHAGAFTQSFTATANTAVTLPAGATASSNNLLSSATAVGIVTGTPSSTTYLRGDGTWATVSSGSGTVNSGTANQLAYYASTGTAVSTLGSLGTSGQVLTSGGAGVAPSWSTPSAGAMTLISTLTATSGTSVTWTGLSGYDKYQLIFENVISASNGLFLYLQLGTGSSPTYVTSGYNIQTIAGYNYNGTAFNGATTNNSAFILAGAASGMYNGGTTTGAGGSVILTGMLGGSNQCALATSYSIFSATSGAIETDINNGMSTNTTAITAIKILFSTGTATFTNGKFSLYGISS